MILCVDYIKQWQRIPRTLKRLECLQVALGEPIVLCLANDQVGGPSADAVRIGGETSNYDVLGRAHGLLPQAVASAKGLKEDDVLICRGAGIAKRLREAGANVPECLRVLYVHDDPFPNSVRDNDAVIGWLKPHIIFSMQPGRVERYKKLAAHAEWGYYGVDTELFHPRDVPIECDVAMGSHVPSKIYNVRFEWMGKLAEKCNAVIAQKLTYADYVHLLASARICVDIPNSRQLNKGGAWSWMVNYRAFEIAAMRRPNLLPDLPGYKKAFRDIAFFYEPTYGGFERSVMKLLGPRVSTIGRYVDRGLEIVRKRFSMKAVTRHEAKVIQNMRK